MTVPKTFYSGMYHSLYTQVDDGCGFYTAFYTRGSAWRRFDESELPEDTVELIPADEADQVFNTLNQLEMELCELLGLDWLLTNWGDIQTAVAELVKYPKYLVISEGCGCSGSPAP